MNSYVTGSMIKELREQKNYTQKKLADLLMVSEKTISKWETKRGVPDISLLSPLADALGISLVELFKGKQVKNYNRSANVLKTQIYVCPICGNIVTSLGNGVFLCCGNEMIVLEADECCDIVVQDTDGRFYIEISSPMTKTDYISFIAYITDNSINIVKTYPEQMATASFEKNGHGYIYYYSNRNGLFKKRV